MTPCADSPPAQGQNTQAIFYIKNKIGQDWDLALQGTPDRHLSGWQA